MNNALSLKAVTMVLCTVWCVAGCSSSETEMQQWMKEQRSTIKPKVDPVSEPKTFQPQKYLGENVVSPFSAEKLVNLLRAEMLSGAHSGLLGAELNRRREPLESVPLDSLAMVGILEKGGRKVALLKSENLLYQVGVGNYLGQNYGKVVRITESDLTVREIVQDAAGEWVERPAQLQLLEGKK